MFFSQAVKVIQLYQLSLQVKDVKAKACKNRAIQLAQWTGALLHTINEMLKKKSFQAFQAL